ncbi:MAG: nicotinamide riboside transporter PnuC [bacterium]|nr:nicotinamide riboside transporter PnuC [bacterium]
MCVSAGGALFSVITKLRKSHHLLEPLHQVWVSSNSHNLVSILLLLSSVEEVGFFETFWEGVVATSLLEWFGVVFGLTYLVLAAYRSIWCWLFAFVASAIYVYLCFSIQLYIESVLQLFYVVMAVVGWLNWNADTSDSKVKIDVVTWKPSHHVINVLGSGVLAFALGWIFDTYTDQANPYLDASTTVYSLVATFMLAQRVLENWIYWIVIDAISIGLYASRGLYLTSVQYFIFTLLAAYCLYTWWRQYQTQKT